MVALQYAVSPAWPTDIPSARAEVDRLLADVPVAAWAARPDEVRRAARLCLDTASAARRRSDKVGERPAYDEAGAARAIDACAVVAAARDEVRVVKAEAHRLLLIGNIWGAAGLITAAALLVTGFDPMNTLIYLAISAAAAGPLCMFAISLWQRSLATIRLDAARSAWAAALAATPFDTMGNLNARRIALRAWQGREAEARVAEASARSAMRAWHGLVGDDVSPADAPALAARLTAARAAQLVLLHAYVDTHRTDPRAGPSALRVVDLDAEPDAKPDQEPTQDDAPREGWLSRVRGRRLRLFPAL
jgi:hypothetical protein